ncbi:hypothetical protein C7I55_21605 [Sphingomonas deserti]|uniref:Uncharacterized protein n=2 Tax=Allosphingosinicella deserti TaxID=2116704 RepID=A0A2P7QI77_9SPHN|nr:hypothetical protein C7I55_21605 [Sphingomonas deserti]
MGEKIVPTPLPRENDADNVWGPAWHAWRTQDGHVLEYDTGDLAGTDRLLSIDAEAFERLRADPGAFDALIAPARSDSTSPQPN